MLLPVWLQLPLQKTEWSPAVEHVELPLVSSMLYIPSERVKGPQIVQVQDGFHHQDLHSKGVFGTWSSTCTPETAWVSEIIASHQEDQGGAFAWYFTPNQAQTLPRLIGSRGRSTKLIQLSWWMSPMLDACHGGPWCGCTVSVIKESPKRQSQQCRLRFWESKIQFYAQKINIWMKVIFYVQQSANSWGLNPTFS